MVEAFDLSGMRVAISGAGGGIGSATARLVASMGADVMLADLEAPAPLADYISSKGREATATALDVTDRAGTGVRFRSSAMCNGPAASEITPSVPPAASARRWRF